MEPLLIYKDEQYEITTTLDVNGVEHAKNFIEVSFGALKDFADQNGLTKDEILARVTQLREKFEATLKEYSESLK